MTENEVREKQEVQTRKEDFFELIVNNPNQASPFLQFSWCMNNKGIEYLRERKVLHPFLLVVILNKKPYSGDLKDYERQLYPLDRGMGHIEFSCPGKYKIHASVVWTSDSSEGKKQEACEARKEIYDRYLLKSGKFRYEKDLHDEVSYRPDFLKHSSLPYHDEIEVMIDENLFAPEPSRRLKCTSVALSNILLIKIY